MVGRLIGVAALFSGVALLSTILLRASLAQALLASAAGFGLVLAIALFASGREFRRRALRIILSGVVAGILATLAYDASRFLLSQLDPSPYNPFETLQVFGRLLTGDPADSPANLVTGAAYHLLNGTTFGLAYALLFGQEGRATARWAIGSGVGWGLFLELFQVSLYPGWLNITALQREFVAIGALGHVVYGAALGLTTRVLLRRMLTGREN